MKNHHFYGMMGKRERTVISTGLTKKIKALCAIRGITQSELATKLNTPQSNLSKKYKLDNWKESDLEEIGNALNADFKGCFILRENGEQV